MPDNIPYTLGLELESVIASREDMIKALKLESKKSPHIKSVTRDASVESPLCNIGETSSLFLGNKLLRDGMRRRNPVVCGYEVVTYPLEMDVMRQVINQTINMQVRMGEIFSERSSIHVHAGFPEGLIFSKGAVAMGLKVEPLFYKIAGMGSTFRGITNHSAYCRPLALPPAVRLTDSDKLAILNPEASLSSDSSNRFWNCFGIRPGDRERYNPLRYFGINVFSTLLRGTLEFRFFNFCTVSKYVEAIASLAQFVTDLALRVPLEVWNTIPQVSIFSKNKDSDYNLIMDCLLDLGWYYNSELPMKVSDIKNVRELIFKTPQPDFFNEPILSHINSGRITLGEAKEFGLEIIEEGDAQPAGIVDIHTFNNSNRELLGGTCAS